MDAAAVVPDHATQRVVIVRCGIGAEGQPVRRGGVAQSVEDAAGLDPREPVFRIDLEDAVEIARKIDAERGVAALAGEAGPAAASDDRRIMLSSDPYRLNHLVTAARIDQTDRHLAVVGRIGRIERLGLRAEVDAPAKSAP